MFSPELLDQAEAILAQARAKGLKIATAESCTGGLIAGLLTEIAGSSDVFERGFVTYSNKSKTELLGVEDELIREYGAVSSQVAVAMADGALTYSGADISIAVTGVAGPGGGSAHKPVGLVYIASMRIPSTVRGGALEYRFGDLGRTEVRLKTVEAALRILKQLL
ncbi:MAG: CinA family protein [Alphaproteobacteria bacterium]|nr:CinA family protein [Alphaproteobacteria bacterium]